ncbi:formimidoylglutamate deiminase [Pseudogemmobacter faecipullorum]|uniref:Formimidoylglutamate deiminase n=1 Tax=Pseudogemmobacter faecipullorum TaxID=2755041 RepID=A0ABS8CRA5_9RHOB|nr:formimidoylglutamate deiminase [Pseudogemmobacter faecipullorum]MCB5411927.1 formimidoylglutamate deiminase [Pseudogemmobacter faecipullorum]
MTECISSKPTVIWAKQALLAKGWAKDVALGIGADGRILSIAKGPAPAGAILRDVLVHAPANTHSHAFQRAMAGLSERRGAGQNDSFWTWRQLMYRFLDRITPDQVQAIAAFVQMEMLEAGFGANVEFHYLHHSPGGQTYDDLAELSARIAAAAEQTGIGLTLLPVHYAQGGCDGRALSGGQLRFGNDADQFARLHEGAGRALASLPADTRLGVAPHSLRAVAARDLAATIALAGDGPVHMHLAEQQAEVDEVLAATGARPVEWALANLDVSPQWCLIHCTRMLPEETIALARSGAVAGLCPLTEASLGDGIFDAIRWAGAGGALSIGSDSNIRISLAEELRQLDTSQRLRDHSRAALATPEHSTGRRLIDAISRGGAQAAGRGAGTIAVGEWADLLTFDMDHPDLTGLQGDFIPDSFAFAGDSSMVRDVWSAGRHLVQEGRHIRREAIRSAYIAAVRTLRAEA